MKKKYPRLQTRAKDQKGDPILSNMEVAAITCATYLVGKKRGLNVLQQFQVWNGEERYEY